MKLFGIIGEKFSGKSLASSFFRKQFIPVVDLDDMYKPIFLPGNRGHKILINYIGEEVLANNGFIDMGKLSLLICNEKWIRDMVDDILDSEFESIIKKLRNAFSSYDIMVGGADSYIAGLTSVMDKFDFTILIDSGVEDRRERMRRIDVPDVVIDKVLENEKTYDKITSRYIIRNDSKFVEFEKNCFETIDKIKSDYING